MNHRKSSRLLALCAPLLLPLLLLTTAQGCAATKDAETETPPSPKEQALADYNRTIDDLVAEAEACDAEVASTGKCTSIDADQAGAVKPLDLIGGGGGGGLVSRAGQALLGLKGSMCEVAAPFARLQHPYFFQGGSVQTGAGVVGQVGADIVYDLWNQQVAVFSYRGTGIATLAGIEGSAYMGYGFGDKANVIDAWSGRFCQASGSIGLRGFPGGGVGAGLGVFASPDVSIIGMAVGVSGYLGLSTPGGGGGIFSADWSPWNAGTQAFNASGWGSRTLRRDGAGHEYIQYASAVAMSSAVFWRLPAGVGAAVAAQIAAIAALRTSGLTIEQACPQEVAQATPPSIVLKAGGLCGSAPNPVETALGR